MPAILDVAIGTVFIFLLFSLVVSALNEVILSKFDQRAKFLHMGLQELFGEAEDPANRRWRQNWKSWITGGLLSELKLTGMTLKLCSHGLINALSRTDTPGASSPSYIPAGSFVTALLGIISQPATPAPGSVPAPISSRDAWSTLFLGSIARELETLVRDQTIPAEQRDASLAHARATIQQAIAALPASYNAVSARLNAQFTAAAAHPSELLAVTKALGAELFGPAGVEHTAANIEKWINALPAGRLRESLHSLFLVAEQDVDEFKAAVEGWFNATMDRVGGWYKRFAQKWMILLGFALAAILNVDTIHIVRELSVSPNLAKAVASQATSYSRSGEKPMTQLEAQEESRVAVERAQAAVDAAPDAHAKDIARQHLAEIEAAVDADAKLRGAITRLSSTGIPMGWDDEQRRALGIEGKHFTLGQIVKGPFEISRWPGRWLRFREWLAQHFTTLIALILGWGLTAVAASLGAPFWFDTLNRFVNLRNAGRPPGEADPTAKSTKPPPSSLDKVPGTPNTTAR